MQDSNFLDILQAAEVETADEISTTEFIDSGAYILNALISASLYGGFPNNRVSMLAGSEGTGKTFFALSCVRKFLEEEATQTLYFDTEFALEKEMLTKRDIDPDRVHVVAPATLQDFRTKCLRILDAYEAAKKKTKLLMVLDSLGNLPTVKEVTDSTAGSDTRDMTKAQIIRSIFRVLTQRLGRNNIPLIVANHTYDAVGAYVPTKVISGGGGSAYAASTTLMLSKAKDKNGNDVIGNIIKVRTQKSRFSKEQQRIELKLNFNTGLDRYYGLLPLAEKYQIIKKVTTRYEMPDGTKVFGKAINEDPEKYFTKDILDRLEEVARIEFGLGTGDAIAKEALVTETVTTMEDGE